MLRPYTPHTQTRSRHVSQDEKSLLWIQTPDESSRQNNRDAESAEPVPTDPLTTHTHTHTHTQRTHAHTQTQNAYAHTNTRTHTHTHAHTHSQDYHV